MVNYKCKKCNKEFTKKDNYVKHAKRKFSCCTENGSSLSTNDKKSANQNIIDNTVKIDSIDKTIDKSELKHQCKKCNKEFTKKYNLNAHMKKYCKNNTKIDGNYKSGTHGDLIEKDNAGHNGVVSTDMQKKTEKNGQVQKKTEKNGQVQKKTDDVQEKSDNELANSKGDEQGKSLAL